MAYGYTRTITIDPTKVGGSDLVNYPLMVAGTFSYLAVVASGGKVTSASGYDIQFFSDSGLTTALKFERNVWVAATGQCVFFVKVPSVSAAVGTVIYLAYGNSAVTTDQSDKVNVWDSDYRQVYHFGDGITLNGLDSTVNAVHLTNSGSTATAGPVNLVSAVNFDGINDNMVNTSATTTGSITVEYWNNVVSGQATASAVFMYAGVFQTDGHITALSPYSDNTFYWDHGNATAAQGRISLSYVPYLGAWTHVAVVFNASTNLHAIYLNGALAASHINSNQAPTLTILSIGNILDVVGTPTFFKGKVAEFRVSRVARPLGWITANYNTQNAPATFAAVGAETAGPGGGGGGSSGTGHTGKAWLSRKRRRDNLARQFGQ